MIKVLYVDDEEALLELCKAFLERSRDMVVDTAPSALAASKRLAEASFDAVIADYQMPVMNGLDFLRAVRAQGNQIPFILFTGKGREEVVIEAMNSGCDFYVQKGGDPRSQFAELDHKVRQAIRRQRAELDLKKSEANYRTVFESASDEITLHDPETGEVVDANQAALRGRNCASVAELNEKPSQLSPPYSLDEAVARLKKTLVEGPQVFEWYIPDRNGQEMWQEVRLEKVLLDGKIRVMAFARDITDRKKEQDRLRESEEKMRLALEAANESLFELDVDTLEMIGSKGLFQMMGYPRIDGPASLDYLQDLIHPDDLSIVMEWLQGDREAPNNSVTMRVKNASGQYRWLDIKSDLTAREGRSGHTMIMGTIRDVTERKEAEEAVRNSVETMKALIDATSDMAMLIDSQWTILASNDAFARSMGLRKEQLIGRSLLPVAPGILFDSVRIPEEVLQKRLRMIKDVLRTGAGVTFQDNREGRTLQHAIRPILGFDGRVERIALYVKDITDQLNAERALRESEERFRSFVEQASDAILITDEEGGIIVINSAALAVMGMERERLLGVRIWDLHYQFLRKEKRVPEALEPLISMYQEVLRTGKGEWLKKIVEETVELPSGRGMTLQLVFWVIATEKGHRLAVAIRDVTQQKRSEEALRESEEKFREFIRQSSDAIMLWDEKGDLCDYNQAALDLLRLDVQALASMKGWDMHQSFLTPEARTPERMEMMRRRFEMAHQTGQSPFLNQVKELNFQRADGERRIGQIVIFPIKTSRGFRLGAVLRDITENKRAESVAAESEIRLRRFVDEAFEGIYIISADGSVVDCNRSFLSLFRLQRGEVIGAKVWDLMMRFMPSGKASPEYSESLKGRIMDSLRTGIPSTGDRTISARILRPDGTWMDIEQMQFAFPSQDGFNIGVVVRDVTDTKRAEEVLRQNEENHRTLFDSLLDSILIFDIDTGEVVDCNKRPIQYLGYASAEEMLNEGWPEGYSRQRNWEAIKKASAEGSSSYEWKVKAKNGQVLDVEVRVRPVVYSGKPRIMAVVRDITERKRAEQTLLEFNRKLNLLSGITRHDILNQLTVLTGFLELQREMTTDAESLRHLSKIERSAATIREQIEFTRDYEEMGTKQPTWHRVAMVFDALPQIKSVENVAIGERVHQLEVLADPMLRKVFYNLVENSLRHGGRIRNLTLGCERVGEDLVIVYSDDGSGVPPEEKELIFEKGFGRGTGLGMFLSREILAITRMTIVENGEPGKGARFEIRVPPGAYRFV